MFVNACLAKRVGFPPCSRERGAEPASVPNALRAGPFCFECARARQPAVHQREACPLHKAYMAARAKEAQGQSSAAPQRESVAGAALALQQ